MKVVLDACVLFPPVLREILIGAAAAGLFTPLWSARILEEWARATTKLGAVAEAQARTEAGLLEARFARANVPAAPQIEARLHLPDANDLHVLAVAILAGADAILTYNARDFPRHVLAAEGVARRDPDSFLWEMWSHHPQVMAEVLEAVRLRGEAVSGRPQTLRAMLKRVQLNRLARAIDPPAKFQLD